MDDRTGEKGVRTRVLHVINGMQLGGAEALLYRLVSRPSRFDHQVIALSGRDWYSSRFEELGIPIEHLGMGSPGAAVPAILRLRTLIRRGSPDVVQTWMYRSNVLGGLLARLAGVPVVWGIHCSSLEPLRPASRALVRASGVLARWIPDLIVNCSTRSSELHAKLGYQRAPGTVIHNGYDPGAFFPDDISRARMRNALGIGPETFLLGGFARWHPQKDIPNLLRAVRMVADRGTPVRCLLAGAELGPSNPELVRAIAEAGCESLVIALGPRSDLPELARCLDLHLLASCGGEAFPNVVAETMLSGVPNVVTDVGDSALMVAGAGWVAPTRDPVRFAAAIEAAFAEWHSQPELWRRRRSDARQAIASRFAFEAMAQAYEAIWEKLARAPR